MTDADRKHISQLISILHDNIAVAIGSTYLGIDEFNEALLEGHELLQQANVGSVLDDFETSLFKDPWSW